MATDKDANQRLVMAMRHGERLDDLFKRDTVTWKMRCLAEESYQQWDERMPSTLSPFDERPLKDFADDPPLSSFGCEMAKAVGAELLAKGLIPGAIYASPSLRCIQTAEFVSRCFENARPKIRVEVGLYGTSYSHIEEPRSWLSVAELMRAGYHIDSRYASLMSQSELWSTRNSVDAYKERINTVVNKIVEIDAKSYMILIVGHASTPDLVQTFLSSPKARSEKSFAELGAGVPYCGNVLLHFRRPSETHAHKSTLDAVKIHLGSFINTIDRGQFTPIAADEPNGEGAVKAIEGT